MEPNPPWAENALLEHWPALVAQVDPAWLPTPKPVAAALKRQILGCGSYGCVYRTQRPGLVLKVSSDPSEYDFVVRARALPWPEGIVRYEAVLDLPAKRRGRPVFAVWREEARAVGQHDQRHYAWRAFYRYHDKYLAAARWLKDRSDLKTWPKHLAGARHHRAWARENVSLDHGDGVVPGAARFGHLTEPMRTAAVLKTMSLDRAIAVALRICELAFELEGSTAYAYEVGEALGFYLDHGMLLADVHWQNIGTVDRPDYRDGLRVITDPGHMVVVGALE